MFLVLFWTSTSNNIIALFLQIQIQILTLDLIWEEGMGGREKSLLIKQETNLLL